MSSGAARAHSFMIISDTLFPLFNQSGLESVQDLNFRLVIQTKAQIWKLYLQNWRINVLFFGIESSYPDPLKNEQDKLVHGHSISIILWLEHVVNQCCVCVLAWVMLF